MIYIRSLFKSFNSANRDGRPRLTLSHLDRGGTFAGGIVGTITLAILAFAIMAGQTAPLAAEEARLRVISERDLQFGSFAVLGSGYREVTPSGSVHDVGTSSIAGGGAGPARLTVRYDRGTNDRSRINLRIELVISPPLQVQAGRLNARISNYRTDLPNAANITPGQVIEVMIPNCVSRICEKTFHLGARLHVNQQLKGAAISIPIPVDARVISLD